MANDDNINTNNNAGLDTYVSEFYIYTQAFTDQNLGYASAMGMTVRAGVGRAFTECVSIVCKGRQRTDSSSFPISAGLRVTLIPHSSITASFSCAVPLPPEMIAPA